MNDHERSSHWDQPTSVRAPWPLSTSHRLPVRSLVIQRRPRWHGQPARSGKGEAAAARLWQVSADLVSPTFEIRYDHRTDHKRSSPLEGKVSSLPQAARFHRSCAPAFLVSHVLTLPTSAVRCNWRGYPEVFDQARWEVSCSTRSDPWPQPMTSARRFHRADRVVQAALDLRDI